MTVAALLQTTSVKPEQSRLCIVRGLLQRKLTIGASNDPLEREADRVAEKVVAMPEYSEVNNTPPSIQRLTGHQTGSSDEAPARVERVLASPGRPLDPALRQGMEKRFGYDFSKVRVHTDSTAGESVREVNAIAYTVGSSIVFDTGRYAPWTFGGQRLIAHELTHVVQQTGACSKRIGGRLQRHKDDLVAYSGGTCGLLQVIKAGRWIYSANAVSGHAGHGENEPDIGPIPSGRYVLHPGVTRATVASLQTGTCGANGILSGYQEITSMDSSPCSGMHYCNVPCPTPNDPGRKCFTPKDCWGSQRIKIEGGKTVTTPAGKRKLRSGFYIHGGNPADAISSGCVKTLDEGVFTPIRMLTGVKGAVPFCVGSTCNLEVMMAIIRVADEAVTDKDINGMIVP